MKQNLTSLRAALVRIEKWFGEFPDTGKTWPQTDRPMSYGSCYGSNGERDYMRQIARDALSAAPASPEVTEEMVDLALKAWFASPPSETDQGLERSMRAALGAAIIRGERGG